MTTLLSILTDCQPKARSVLQKFFHLDETQLLAELSSLREQGLQIHERGDFVQLESHLPLLNLSEIRTALVPYHIYYQPVMDSTNEFILQNLANLKKGDLCLTEYQQAGRGRRGRRWQSPFGGQIILSFAWQVSQQRGLEGISTVIGLGILHAFLELGLYGFQVKWPNDILINDRKIAGILVEIGNCQNGQFNLVVGIGLNMSLGALNSIDQSWAEMHEFYPDVSREELITQMIKSVYHYLEIFEKQGISPEWQKHWIEHNAFLGIPVNIIGEHNIVSGVIQGIDEKGYLLLMTETGIEKFAVGEVSLRKA